MALHFGPTQLGSWVPIAAVQTASGYDVALELPASNEFTVWATNSSGAYVSSLVGIVPGNNATLESCFETVFNKDLNGDQRHRCSATAAANDHIRSTETQPSFKSGQQLHFLDVTGQQHHWARN